jgi:peptidoglycan/LPS O-acetylase OafA/YrhL
MVKMVSASRPSIPENGHFVALDWLRAVAALSVFVHHFYQQYAPQLTGKTGFIHAFMIHLGSWGVCLFFILSGFCIHWSRLLDSTRTQGFQPRIFAIRRFFRIYPALFVAVILCYVIEQFYTSNLLNSPSLGAVFAHLMLVSSFSVEYRGAINNVLWTVIVECHFYILYFFLWRLFDGPRKIMAVTMIAIGLAAATFLVSVTLFEPGKYRVLVQHIFLASWWSWCLGALLAELLFKKELLPGSLAVNRLCLYGLVTLSLIIGLLPHQLALQSGRFILPFLTLGIVYFMLVSRYDFDRQKTLVFTGVISYSLYLFHPIAILIGVASGLNVAFSAVLVFSVGILLASANYVLVEAPFMALGKRIVTRYKTPKTITVPSGSASGRFFG